MRLQYAAKCAARAALVLGLSVLGAAAALAQAVDPGVRQASTDNQTPPPALPNSTKTELAFFLDGFARFSSVKSVRTSGGDNSGLGPRFNSDACSSCHSQPFIGGSSPAVNPLPAVASTAGARNIVPWFIVPNGPIREARFIASSNGAPDGGVHDLFVVTGRSDVSPACTITQPVFTPAGNGLTGQGGNRNIIYRIPTPVLGAGLIEAIPDTAILNNMSQQREAKEDAGIRGHPNLSGNDGTITRFGWKAQNKSLLLFSGEAYNVEMGVSNLLFPQERSEIPACQGFGTPSTPGNLIPNDTATFASTADPATGLNPGVLSDMEAFADFMRTLAAPVPAAATASTQHGSAVFTSVGCALCHTPTLKTGPAAANGDEGNASVALTNQSANLFSDLLLHHMGTGLADHITQGAAGPDEFRTAPLWGVGQRIFFLHDGRTTDLVQAIRLHASTGSEANRVVNRFLGLRTQDQQDLINFLRSL
jgi:CxxC motif-containing protein (DUF1111 family)